VTCVAPKRISNADALSPMPMPFATVRGIIPEFDEVEAEGGIDLKN